MIVKIYGLPEFTVITAKQASKEIAKAASRINKGPNWVPVQIWDDKKLIADWSVNRRTGDLRSRGGSREP